MNNIIIICLSIVMGDQSPIHSSFKPATPVPEQKRVVPPVMQKQAALLSSQVSSLPSQAPKTVAVPVRIAPAQSSVENLPTGLVFENGAFYFKTQHLSIPLTGGGASGCLNGTPNSIVLEQVLQPTNK